MRRLTAEQPVQWYHAYQASHSLTQDAVSACRRTERLGGVQHVYMAALYSLLTLKGIFFDDFHSVFTRKIGP